MCEISKEIIKNILSLDTLKIYSYIKVVSYRIDELENLTV